MVAWRWLVLSICVPVFVALGQTSAASSSVLEKIEWTWADSPATRDSALPNVLLLGDSITRAYFPEVSKLLAGKANVYLFATSAAAGDPRLAKQLDDYFTMEHLDFAVIHFNNGMHGWGYSDADYSQGLPTMVKTLRQDAPAAKLIWATTTPVHSAAESGASNERINARNAAALTLMKSLAIPVDDQHALMSTHDDLHQDNVHYKAEGSQLQAKEVAQMVAAALPHDKR